MVLFQILLDRPNFTWVRYEIGEEMPDGALQGGVTERNEPLYVTRGQVTDEEVSFGWFNPLDKTTCASFEYYSVVSKTVFDIRVTK